MLWMLAPTWWIPSQAFLLFPKVSFIFFLCKAVKFDVILLICCYSFGISRDDFLTKFLQLFSLYVLQLRASDLIFTSLIQSLFLYRVRGLKFEPSIYMVIQLSLSHLLKRLPLYISGSLFKDSVGHRCMGLFLQFFYSIGQCVWFYANIILFWLLMAV